MDTCQFCGSIAPLKPFELKYHQHTGDQEEVVEILKLCMLCRKVFTANKMQYHHIHSVSGQMMKAVCIVGNTILQRDDLKEKILDLIDENEGEIDCEGLISHLNEDHTTSKKVINDLLLSGEIMMQSDTLVVRRR